jgi:hypothetical protein
VVLSEVERAGRGVIVLSASRRREAPSTDQRIADPEIRKTAEVAVGGPDLVHLVLETEGGDARVVHPRTLDPAVQEERPRPCQ